MSRRPELRRRGVMLKLGAHAALSNMRRSLSPHRGTYGQRLDAVAEFAGIQVFNSRYQRPIGFRLAAPFTSGQNLSLSGRICFSLPVTSLILAVVIHHSCAFPNGALTLTALASSPGGGDKNDN